MKFLEKLSLVLFSNIIIILSVLLILILFGWMQVSAIEWLVGMALNSTTSTNITLGVCIVLILLAVKCIFFGSSEKEEDLEAESFADGILLENADGKLLITKETIKNIALNVIEGFEGALSPKVELEMDKQNKVKLNVVITAKELTAINQLSKNIQLKVKETIKNTTDLELSAVNVAIRNQRILEKEEVKENVED